MEQNINQPSQKLKHRMPKNSWWHKNQKVIVVAIAMLLLITVVTIIATATIENKKKADQTAVKCASESADSFVKTSSAQLANTKYKELDATAKEIKKLSNYYNYPNCNYIAAVNALNFGNTKEANEMYVKLSKLDFKAISPLLKAQTGPDTLEYIRKQIELIELLAKQNQQNFTATGRNY